MTIQELKDAVAKLGFEDVLEDDKQFYLTVNRCIYQVSRVRPTVATLRIDHFPIKNQLNTNASEPQNYSGNGFAIRRKRGLRLIILKQTATERLYLNDLTRIRKRVGYNASDSVSVKPKVQGL